MANDISTWECELRRNGECRAYIKFDLFEDFIEQRNEHSHPPSQAKCNITKTKVNLKRKVTETMDTTRQILPAELGNVSEVVAVGLPSIESMRRSIRNQRQDRNQHQNPITRAAIPETPQESRQTQYGERFLFFDSGVGDKNRLILFGAEHAIQYLRESSHWCADGTFKFVQTYFFKFILYRSWIMEDRFPAYMECCQRKLKTLTTDCGRKLAM